MDYYYYSITLILAETGLLFGIVYLTLWPVASESSGLDALAAYYLTFLHFKDSVVSINSARAKKEKKKEMHLGMWQGETCTFMYIEMGLVYGLGREWFRC